MEKHKTENGKIIIGLIEMVGFVGNNGTNQEVKAKVDTGATRSSIDIKLASKLN